MAEPRPERPEVITLSIPSRLELLNLVDQVASVLSAHLRFGEEERAAISLAVVEAGTNAIQHGSGRDPARPVEVVFSMYPDRLEVSVHDQGPGFDLAGVSGDVTLPEHLLDSRGRGIFIMRACMDSVDFTFDESGTTCRLVKRRSSGG